MARMEFRWRRRTPGVGLPIACCIFGLILVGPLEAQEPAPPSDPLPTVLTRSAAVDWMLRNHPELAALRQQHGIAVAAVVIAQAYPFNPILESKVRGANGPPSAGVTNHLPTEHRIAIDLELRGQGRYRKQAACAGLSRTDWEIAFQEQTAAIRLLRAFNAVLYREQKQALLDETIRLNQQTVKQVGELVGTKFTAADLVLARTEVDDARSQLGMGRVALVTARQDLRHALGILTESGTLQGSLELPLQEAEPESLTRSALERRADLHARQAAVTEAEARWRLAVADRFGNPNFGPDYEYDPSQINLIGVQVAVPLPVLNTHRGEIQQRLAERTRAALELRQTEVLVRQDVAAALARLENARQWAETYRTQVLPSLQAGLKDVMALFAQANVDLLKVIDVRRKVLKARDGYLDALFEVSQAQVDLAAAVGDLSLALEPQPKAP